MKTRILFVCLGNICRSPAAEGIMRRIVEHTAAALGAEAELTDYTIANYKVENDAASSERCRQAVIKCLGPTGQGHYRGTLSGEDFRSTCAAYRACSPL